MTDTPAHFSHWPHPAHDIVINHVDHTIHIDGELFPYSIEVDPQAVLLEGLRSLRIGILTDKLTVIDTQGESRHA